MHVLRSAVVALAVVAACGGDGGTMATTPNLPGGGGGGGGGSGDTCAGTTTSVSVNDDFFSPTCTKVAVGATVTWTWNGANPHNVTFANTALGASLTQTAGTYQKTFPNAGNFGYSCTVHPGMNGTIQVQ